MTGLELFPGGWARVKNSAYGYKDQSDVPVGMPFTIWLHKGQFVRVEREVPPDRVWVLAGPLRVYFPASELEPATAAPTFWERLVGPDVF